MNTGDVQTATLTILTMTRRRHGKIPTKSDQAAAWLLLVNSHGTAGPLKPNPSQAKQTLKGRGRATPKDT